MTLRALRRLLCVTLAQSQMGQTIELVLPDDNRVWTACKVASGLVNRFRFRLEVLMRLVSWSLASAFLLTASPLSAALATAYQDATHLSLENDVLKIAVLRTTGSLDGIIHKQSGVNLQS